MNAERMVGGVWGVLNRASVPSQCLQGVGSVLNRTGECTATVPKRAEVCQEASVTGRAARLVVRATWVSGGSLGVKYPCKRAKPMFTGY